MAKANHYNGLDGVSYKKFLNAFHQGERE